MNSAVSVVFWSILLVLAGRPVNGQILDVNQFKTTVYQQTNSAPPAAPNYPNAYFFGTYVDTDPAYFVTNLVATSPSGAYLFLNQYSPTYFEVGSPYYSNETNFDTDFPGGTYDYNFNYTDAFSNPYNADVIFDIILDPATGDILSTRGRGDIKVEILRSGEFSMYGRYEIDEGNYLFTMQNIVNKKFELDKGGTISFRGDVNNAQLDADAVYHVRTSTYNLISDLLQLNGVASGSDVDSRAKNRINVDLMLKLKGVLQSPEISFDIRPIDPDPSIRTYVDNKMQLMRTTESEMNKQVFGLLVMNQFLPSGNGSTTDAITSGRSIGNSATNTVSEFLSSQLSIYTGSFFENLNVKGLDLLLNFQSYDQTSVITPTPTNSSDVLNARKEVQLALSKKFFNNRLSVNVGGNVDFGDNYQNLNPGVTTNNKNAYATGDFEVEYVLDKNGAWRAKTYNRNDYDNFNNRNINKTGIGLSFRQDFDNWADLFHRIVNKKKAKASSAPAAKPEEAPKVLDR